MVSFEKLLEELERQTDVSREELEERIDKKQKELSGLVSMEGAAHLVAKDLGINLIDESRRRLEMKNVVSGMKNVNVVGRIFRISNIIDFKRKDGSDGRVANLFLGDGTGSVRLPLWNDQVNMVEEETVKVGDAIQVINGMTKENIYGDVEISLGKYGSIKPVEDLELPSVRELLSVKNIVEKEDVKDSGNFELTGTVVHVFKGSFMFDTCSVCGSTFQDGKCLEHGEVKSSPNLVVSCIVDNGTEDIRAVTFRSLAEKFCDVNTNELVNLSPEERYKLIAEKLIGKELTLGGKVKNNKIFNRLELIVNSFEELNVLEKSKELMEKIKVKLVDK
jgi:replication factor A1